MNIIIRKNVSSPNSNVHNVYELQQLSRGDFFGASERDLTGLRFDRFYSRVGFTKNSSLGGFVRE